MPSTMNLKRVGNKIVAAHHAANECKICIHRVLELDMSTWHSHALHTHAPALCPTDTVTIVDEVLVGFPLVGETGHGSCVTWQR
ncbi:hypothetical protein PCASD_04617 [Puccinia coronata f. sp. avenae]|uniref:Uncharacterized protein n=1 Tax=Puccinia coronata f. sp. avenae TaxID=200324 RepID=A0A2N5UXK4_9BASI|nr:hypothetical protein PCASD_04617 [Puccinia coronata f. sp. avenae]